MHAKEMNEDGLALVVIMTKGPDIYILHALTGKPEQQRFTIRGGVLTSTNSRRRGAISDNPLIQRSTARHTHLYPRQPHHYGLQPAMFSGNDAQF